MRQFTLFLLIIGLTGSAFGQGIIVPSLSYAVTDDALSIKSNPAWLGYRPGAEAYFGFPYNDSTSTEDFSLAIKLGGLGFAADFVNNGINHYNQYTLGHGAKLSEAFYFGASYSWYRVVDWQGSWNIGLGFRPTPFFSAGVMAYDLNRPDRGDIELEPSYGIGLALRPLDHRLTLSGDVLFTKSMDHDYGEELDPRIRLDAMPLDGLHLIGEYSFDSEAFGIGLSLAFDNLTLGNFRRMDSESEHIGSVGYAHFTSGSKASIFTPRKGKIVEVTLTGKIHEAKPPFRLFKPRGTTLYEIRSRIIKYADDPAVEGIILRMENPQMGLAQVQELRRTLEDFKLTGKKLYAYADTYTQKGYYLATACDEIYMLSIGGVDLSGLSAVMGYWKGTLDKLGIGVQVVRVRDYKTAMNTFTYEDATEAEAEMLNWLLDDLYDQICLTMAAGRDMTLEEFKEVINAGPYFATNALEAGLVDQLDYYDQLVEKLEHDGELSLTTEKEYWMVPEYEEDWRDTRIPKVAVIYAEGPIIEGHSQDDFWGGSDRMGSKTMAEAIKQAREDDSIDAIIMRVNSPGGSAFATNVIDREVQRTVAEGKHRKPFIVSMGNQAGSGGYYIACSADTIIAEEGTLTGSIGVFGGKANLEGLYKKIYHNTHTFKRGEHADAWRMHRPFSDEEMEMLQNAVDQVYDDFVTKVAEGRPLTKEEVDKIGEGRVWTGRQAYENGLVDLIGGMDLAFEIVRTKLGVEPTMPMRLEFYPKPKGFFQMPMGDILAMKTPQLPEMVHELVEPISTMMEFYDGEPLMLMEYDIEMK